jgi:AcrR family transcriptional regulator
MASLRNTLGVDTAADTTVAERSTADRLLDATRESILSVGWKRTTLTDVARRAGVSRMTVYRTYPDMPSLFRDLMTREWAEIVGEVGSTEDMRGSWPERIASGLVGAVSALRDDELVRRIVDVDPELLLPYLLTRRGRSQDAVLDLLTDRITAAQAEGGIRDGDPVLIARTLVLAAHGFVLSVSTMADRARTEARLDQELTELIRRYLAA